MNKVSCSRVVFTFVSLLAFFFPRSSFAGDSFFQEGSPNIKGLESSDGMNPAALNRFSLLSKELSPAVVNISVEADEDEAPSPDTDKKQEQTPFRSLGSGFIVNQDGFIVTSNHVIDKSDHILVRLLDDKSEYKAHIIGKDKKTDLALLKIEPKSPLKVVHLGNSDDVEVGEWVLAIGNQFELGQTVTAGIVSAKSRRVPTKGSGPYDAFIQTDASINPGSSGGPLFDMKGEVIGVNTAIFTPARSQFGGTGFNIGIGFAVPVNLVKQVIGQLRSQGKVTRGLLGVIIQKIDADMAEALGLENSDGALVADVLKDSPAGRAGFVKRDVITAFNGQPIREYEDLPLMVANTAVGSVVKVDALRDGKPMSFEVKIEELKEEKAEAKKAQKPDKLGLVVDTVPSEIQKTIEGEPRGVIVTQVEPNSPAEKAGITPSDIIEEIEGVVLHTPDEYQQAASGIGKSKPSLVLIRRKEGTRFLTLRLK